MAESGSNPNPEKDRSFASPSPDKAASSDGRIEVLIVEDNRADVFLIKDALALSGFETVVRIVSDGFQAMQFLDAVDSDETMPSPALVILDINLPRRNGFEVLEHLRRSRRCRAASVIVVSTSNAAADRERALHSGGDAFFRKPSEYDAFMQLGSLIRKLFQGRAG